MKKQLKQTKQWQQMLPMTRHMAGIYHLRFPQVPFDDLAEEAETLLQKIILREEAGACWNKTTGRQFETWVYYYLHRRLLTFCTRKQPRHPVMSTVPAGELARLQQKESPLLRLLQTVGDDAATIIKTIVDAPAELIDILASSAPVRSQRAVRHYLLEQGWTDERVNQGWEEVASCL